MIRETRLPMQQCSIFLQQTQLVLVGQTLIFLQILTNHQTRLYSYDRIQSFYNTSNSTLTIRHFSVLLQNIKVNFTHTTGFRSHRNPSNSTWTLWASILLQPVKLDLNTVGFDRCHSAAHRRQRKGEITREVQERQSGRFDCRRKGCLSGIDWQKEQRTVSCQCGIKRHTADDARCWQTHAESVQVFTSNLKAETQVSLKRRKCENTSIYTLRMVILWGFMYFHRHTSFVYSVRVYVLLSTLFLWLFFEALCTSIDTLPLSFFFRVYLLLSTHFLWLFFEVYVLLSTQFLWLFCEGLCTSLYTLPLVILWGFMYFHLHNSFGYSVRVYVLPSTQIL